MQIIGAVDVITARVPWVRSMHPRLTIHRSAAALSMTGNAMMFPEAWRIEHVVNQSGCGFGVRFMKKNGPATPLGYRFSTMARSTRWRMSTGAIVR